MDNRRSKSVTILAVYFLISAVVGVFQDASNFSKFGVMLSIFYIIMAVVQMILAIYIFLLKQWARRGMIYYNIFIAFVTIPLTSVNFKILKFTKTGVLIFTDTASIVFALVIIYFFTRPQVKAQFNITKAV